jgi:hypothetical protein
MTGMSERDERIARNEAYFREQNESIKESNAAHTWFDPPVPDWSCECAWQECRDPVRASLVEYEAVRAFPTRFLIAPDDGHLTPESERVVERHPGFWVIEKTGEAAVVSAALDPRSGDGGSPPG